MITNQISNSINGTGLNYELTCEESPVFIVGCDRSGTTLLRLMLTQSNVLHIPNESKFSQLFDSKEDYGDYNQNFQRAFFVRDLQKNKATAKTYTFPIFNLAVDTALEVLEQAAPTDFFGAIDALFSASARKHGKQRWGDKTPRHINEMPLLAKGYPQAKFVHVIRDGRDVAVSIYKAGWIGTLAEISRYWCKQVEEGQSYGQTLGDDRYYEIRYEKLVLNPEIELEKLCKWLKIDYTSRMLEYYRDIESEIPQQHKSLFELNRKPLESSRIYAWKQTLKVAEIADIESIQSELLINLGYDLSGKRIPYSLVIFRAMKALIKSKLLVLCPLFRRKHKV